MMTPELEEKLVLLFMELQRADLPFLTESIALLLLGITVRQDHVQYLQFSHI